jgi:hypothetical protein
VFSPNPLGLRRARTRERLQSIRERERWSKFTGELVGILQHLRIGELECGRPGDGLVRVLGGNDCGGGGVFVDARKRQNWNQIRRINHEEIALSRASLSDGG